MAPVEGGSHGLLPIGPGAPAVGDLFGESFTKGRSTVRATQLAPDDRDDPWSPSVTNAISTADRVRFESCAAVRAPKILRVTDRVAVPSKLRTRYVARQLILVGARPSGLILGGPRSPSDENSSDLPRPRRRRLPDGPSHPWNTTFLFEALTPSVTAWKFAHNEAATMLRVTDVRSSSLAPRKAASSRNAPAKAKFW